MIYLPLLAKTVKWNRSRTSEFGLHEGLGFIHLLSAGLVHRSPWKHNLDLVTHNCLKQLRRLLGNLYVHHRIPVAATHKNRCLLSSCADTAGYVVADGTP